MLPDESMVAVAAGVWIVVVPPPVTSAVDVSDPAPTTVTVPDPPPPEYCGIFRVFVPCVQVAAPLLPVVVSVMGRFVKFDALPLAGVPSTGVTNVGDVANTSDPLPVSFVTAAAKLALVGVPRKVAMPAARPVTPVEIGNPVALVSTPAEGVPMSGVTKDGEVANTKDPDPVSLVTAEARFALVGVPRNVAIPVASPLTPVLIGNPVAFVNTPAEGVPRFGVTSTTASGIVRVHVPVLVILQVPLAVILLTVPAITTLLTPPPPPLESSVHVPFTQVYTPPLGVYTDACRAEHAPLGAVDRATHETWPLRLFPWPHADSAIANSNPRNVFISAPSP